VVYQIFPDRFARSDAADARQLPDWAIPCDWDTPVIGAGPETPYQFYGGDLDGIVERLDHIASLGVNTVYLTPIFPARSNHRYDAVAFDHVDPLLGGDAALQRLADAVHRRGMRLLGDLTTNHCGQDHPWFTAAMADRTAPEREMFYVDGDDYETWLGVKSLPKLNWGSRELRRRFLDGPDSISRRWLREPYSLDGWRVDVANMTGRRGADSYTHEVAALMRQAVANDGGLLVAEHAHDATGDLDRDGWHATMNYAGFTRPVWNWLRADDLDLSHFLGVPGPIPRRGGAEAVATMRLFGAHMSWRSLVNSWTMLGSHDTARVRTVVGEGGMESALGLLMTMPGAPVVFAGDEIGMTGFNGEDSRRPMPWSSTWDADTLSLYRTLIRARTDNEALRRGGLRWAYTGEDSLAFLRETDSDRLLVTVRRGDGEPVSLSGTGAREAVSVYGGEAAPVSADGTVLVPGDGPAVQIFRLS
jgi:alpha-glucosidase